MLNMVTNLIIKDEIYLLFIKLYSDNLADDIYKFSQIIETQEFVEKKFSFDALNVNMEFRMYKNFRE